MNWLSSFGTGGFSIRYHLQIRSNGTAISHVNAGAARFKGLNKGGIVVCKWFEIVPGKNFIFTWGELLEHKPAELIGDGGRIKVITLRRQKRNQYHLRGDAWFSLII